MHCACIHIVLVQLQHLFLKHLNSNSIFCGSIHISQHLLWKHPYHSIFCGSIHISQHLLRKHPYITAYSVEASIYHSIFCGSIHISQHLLWKHPTAQHLLIEQCASELYSVHCTLYSTSSACIRNSEPLLHNKCTVYTSVHSKYSSTSYRTLKHCYSLFYSSASITPSRPCRLYTVYSVCTVSVVLYVYNMQYLP